MSMRLTSLLWVLCSLAGCATEPSVGSAMGSSTQVHARKDGSFAMYQFKPNGGWTTVVVPAPKTKR